MRLGAAIVQAGLALPSLVHPRAYVAPSATIGEGAFVGALATVSAGAVVGDLALISPSAVLSHHVQVGRGAAVAPGAVLGGRSRIVLRALSTSRWAVADRIGMKSRFLTPRFHGTISA